MTTAYETRKSAAQNIREALKAELNLNSRKVSVRDESGSLETSVHVRVKDATVNLAAVRAVAERFENVRRCEIVGDILGGGNTFVSVEYTPEALAAGGAQYVEAVEAALANLKTIARDTHATIAGTPLTVSQPLGDLDYNIWSDRLERRVWRGCSATEVAGQVFLILNR